MIGDILEKIRVEKNILRADVAKKARINEGHLSHIEKGHRNASLKTLKLICEELETPIEPLLHISDINLTDEQRDYNAISHLKYNEIPIVTSISGYGKCPKDALNASLIMKATDDSMSPKIDKDDYIYVELYVPLNNKDIGVFMYNGKVIVRKFIVRKNDVVLRADNSNIDEIVLQKNGDFCIIGKALGKSDENFENFVPFF